MRISTEKTEKHQKMAMMQEEENETGEGVRGESRDARNATGNQERCAVCDREVERIRIGEGAFEAATDISTDEFVDRNTS